jgi:ABC-type branched-subunit amino acid transport system substrate-binding protein
MAPESGYGRLVAGAFLEVARARGLPVVADLRYPPRTTSFTQLTKQLRRRSIDVVFVADTAQKLELVAPSLAVMDLWSTPRGERPDMKGRRPILLLSTADSISPSLLRNAGRYVQGAVLAPGYYPDPSAPSQTEFVSAYRQAYGEDPSLFDAVAFDAVRAIRAAAGRGARTHEAMLASLRQHALSGVTGALRFAADGSRADPPVLYQVSGEHIQVLP